MKKLNALYPLFALFGAVLILCQCEKNPPENPFYEPYAETNLEANAGNWKTYLTLDSAKTAVPTPDATGSAAYLSELDQLRAKMA